MAEYNNLNNIPAKIVKTSQLPDGVPYYVIGIQSNPLTTVKYPIDQFAATVANLVPNVVKTNQVYTDPTWLGSLSWTKITERPNTLYGYGITDPIVLSSGSYSDPSWITGLSWSKILGAPSFVTSLAALTDVQLTSEVPDQLLKFNGTKWVNWTANFLTSFTETDPIYTASSWYATTNNSSNWNTAYGWGNHALVGYLTGITGTQVTTALGYTPASTTSLTSHTTDTNNPHAVTKTQIGLSNVDNTSDVNKPISNATQTALNAKQDSLGYTAENESNKSTNVDTDKLSDTKYPSVKSVYDWAVGLFATIANLATKTDKNITTNTQTSSYTLVSSDADKNVEMNVATANNLTIPAGTFVAGQQIIVVQYGTGQTTIVAGVGMTLRSVGGYLKIGAQYGAVTIIFRSATEAIVIGNLSV